MNNYHNQCETLLFMLYHWNYKHYNW